MVWADLLRILVIYLVIVVHVTILPKAISTQSFFIISLFAVAKTCVPIFFMLSGALLLPRDEPAVHFFKNRFLRLFRPYIFWTIVFITLLIIVTSHTSFGDLTSDVKTGLRVFWFFPIIVCLYIVTPIIRVYILHASRQQVLYALLIWFFFISLIPFLRNTQAFPIRTSTDILNLTINFSGYFVLGYVLTTVQIFRQKLNAVLLILIGVLWTIIATISLPPRETSINLTYFEYTSPTIVILSIGIFSLFQCMNGFFDAKLTAKQKKIIEGVSVLIFGVYLLHTITIQIFERINISLPHTNLPAFFDYPVSALFIFSVTLFVVFFLSRLPFLRKFIS